MNGEQKQEQMPEFPGLTDAEVGERVRRGQTNRAEERQSRSVAAILRENIFTLFNAILGGLLVLILVFGSLRDALFGLVLFGNMGIGIVQELRAKRTLDRLSVLSAPRAQVIRGGQKVDIPIEDVVLDDVVAAERGDQVVADGEVLSSEGLELDESLLTGEAEPVDKVPGKRLLSGSFVVAGSGLYRATAVGPEAYARQLAAEAGRFQLVKSELRHGINRILAGVTWVMIPAGLLLLIRELQQANFGESISGAVAAMVGMIPQGLVLLTSIAFAVAVVRLGRRNVLVQELPAVEGLARVDVVCFDKTGTLTEPGLQFDRLELVGREGEPGAGVSGAGSGEAPGADEARINAALRALSTGAAQNPTMVAIAARFGGEGQGKPLEPVGKIPFSSERKWSAVVFADESWVLGAPEMLRADGDVAARAQELAAAGMRVLLLSRLSGRLQGESLPEQGLEPVALVLLEEKVRPDAAPTLRFFGEEGVAIKVISGDNPNTVEAVARRAGMADDAGVVDARELPEDPAGITELMESRTIFGRVTARQKHTMVKSLQNDRHVVAMTGDGVNDVLALKDADIGIAVGTGAAAAVKSVAQLVLLDGRFSTLPHCVAEGRRVMADIERVAYLFITKTVYASILAVVIGVLGWPFPFLPRHLTLVDAITIGVPAFFLALAPSRERYRPGFVRRVLHFTIPAGVTLAAATFLSYWLSRSSGADLDQSRTVATLVLTVMGLGVLVILARPLSWWKILLIAAMVGALVIVMISPFIQDFLAFQFPSESVLWESLGIAAAAIAVLLAGMKITGWQPRRVS